MKTQDKTSYKREYIQISPKEDISFDHHYDTGSFCPNHWHNDIELIYLLKGSLTVSTSKGSVFYKEQDLILLNSRVVHSTRCSGENESLLIQIPYSFMKRYISDIDDFFFELNVFSEDSVIQTKILQVKDLLQQMLIVTEYNPDGAKLHFNSLLFELLYMLYHNFKKKRIDTDFQSVEKNLLKLEPALVYIQEYYKENVPLSTISNIAGFQPEYFCRIFKRTLGLTYLEYVQEIRLSHFYNDLLTTTAPINELMERNGITNVKSFRRLFSAHFHTTPLQMRKQQDLS